MIRPVAIAGGMTLLVTLAACGGADGGGETASLAPPSTAAESAPTDEERPVIDPGDGGDYTVTIDPERFTSVVDNPYLPKLPGTIWEYVELTGDGDYELITIEVLDEHRVVMGVDTIVVHDVVTDAEGELIEDTYDWFAQDVDGNVWYFGEDTTAYHDGVASTEGAWEAGVDGALPGIVMPGTPAVTGSGYRQEFRAGEAEDMGEVIGVDGTYSVPAGGYDDIVRTRDWTPLEPGVVEEKAYARGVGWIHESKVDEDGVATIAALTRFVQPA